MPIKDNIPDVPRDRNYRTPQDDATSVDNNVQVVLHPPADQLLGFRDTLSYGTSTTSIPVGGSGLRSARAPSIATTSISSTIAGRS